MQLLFFLVNWDELTRMIQNVQTVGDGLAVIGYFALLAVVIWFVYNLIHTILILVFGQN